MTTSNNSETLYKFVVNSAEEAVAVLRDRLGENAKVISVRQVEGAGLARFLRAPKLEIIARKGTAEPPAPGPEPVRPPEPATQALSPEPPPVAQAPVAAPAVAQTPVAAPTPAVTPTPEPRIQATPAGQALSVEERIAAARAARVSAFAEREKPAATPPDDLSRILQRSGISDVVLAQFRGRDEWPKIARRPIREALTEVTVLLRGDYQRKPKRATGSRVAFIGTAGAGKTTALCKRLAMEVFFKQRQAIVLKVDMEKANPADGLAVFCDVLGVPMVRSLADVRSLAPNETLYVDFPGVTPGNQDELGELSKLLDSVSPDTRVLVINAAYETGLIKSAYRMGAALAATHVVFTHLDELTQWGKLWEFVLSPELTPLFVSSGQNIAGDFDEAVFEAVLERSFRSGAEE